uniref:Uncharacterized protein n=1 Tax=Anguilla anguilla TaxID=7936 RepID=A0A0E9TV06_ANGAN
MTCVTALAHMSPLSISPTPKLYVK